MRMKFKDGEPMKKVFGPIFLYLNSHSSTRTALGHGHPLWQDAKRQMLSEVQSWPYNFPRLPDYITGNQRGTIMGQLFVNDRYVRKDCLFGSFADVGLAAPGPLRSWQRESKVVPARVAVLYCCSWSINLARPKSPSLALNSKSNITLLDLMSLWTTNCSHSSCKYSKTEAKARAILYLTPYGTTISLFWPLRTPVNPSKPALTKLFIEFVGCNDQYLINRENEKATERIMTTTNKISQALLLWMVIVILAGLAGSVVELKFHDRILWSSVEFPVEAENPTIICSGKICLKSKSYNRHVSISASTTLVQYESLVNELNRPNQNPVELSGNEVTGDAMKKASPSPEL
ncbi:hypothetical protein RJ641_011547 [Dillenia turbinata]|uniref:Uncharacterized protein n=1 Tax=Dillenia turbinata TaxID=194707 RepID=A0AAN8UU66_9MAGN